LKSAALEQNDFLQISGRKRRAKEKFTTSTEF